MKTVARTLRALVTDAGPRLLRMSEEHVSAKAHAEKWSIKEILGHLIDSAANNHQRFVRMQLTRDIGVFGYEQVEWNAAQKYQLEEWTSLVNLWTSYNMHLAHVIEHVNPGSLENTCYMGETNPAKLRFVIEDYIRHVQHHLEQILKSSS